MTVDSDVHVLLQVLSGMAARLSEQPDVAGVCAAVLPAAVEALGGQVGTLALLDGPRTLRVLATVGMTAPVTDRWVDFDISAAVPLAGCVRDGVPVWLPDVEVARSRFPAIPNPARSRSLCAVPLRSGSTVIGGLGVGWSHAREFDAAEQHLLLTVAGLAAAACAQHRPPGRTKLETHLHPTPSGVQVGCLSRPGSTGCSVSRPETSDDEPGHRSRTSSHSVFATLLDAEGDESHAMDAVAGVIALARRRELPPALLGNEIASISADLDGAVSGAHLQIDRDGGWLAVAPLDDRTVVVFSAEGAGRPGPSRGGGLAEERIVVANTEPAGVLVVSLHRTVGPAAVAAVREVAQAVCSRSPSDVSALLDSFTAELHATETDDCVRAALAVVLPAAPLRRSRTRVLPARPAACPMARRFAVGALPAAARVDAVRAIELITDELVANAIRFADDTVTLTITDEQTGTLVEVSDTDSRMPVRLIADGQGETGRGLLLVDALADETGVTPDPDGRGKTVWARAAWRRVQS